MTQIREILVRAHNWVGDVVMATPGFRTLRSGFPDARITLHIRPGLEPLVAGAPWFDAVIPVTSHRRGLRALVREGRGLRRTKRFDLGICLPDSFASALLMRVAGVREIVGYRRGGRGPLLNRAVDPPRDAGRAAWIAREHHVLGLVAALGCEASDVRLELFVTGEEEAAARKLLAQHGVGPESPLAVLAPGASYGPSKLWPAPSFARVGDALAQTGATVLVVGSPAETPVARRVVESMRAPAIELTRELALGTLKAVIRRSRVLVCNDAGARHVAVAFGVPCVVVMGPTSLDKTNQNLDRVRVLFENVDCRPCYLRVCPIDHRCMTQLDPRRVIEAAVPAFTAAPRRGERVERNE